MECDLEPKCHTPGHTMHELHLTALSSYQLCSLFLSDQEGPDREDSCSFCGAWSLMIFSPPPLWPRPGLPLLSLFLPPFLFYPPVPRSFTKPFLDLFSIVPFHIAVPASQESHPSDLYSARLPSLTFSPSYPHCYIMANSATHRLREKGGDSALK